MKIATTIIDSYRYFDTPAETVRFYKGTGFRLLDYSFYDVLKGNDPFMDDGWKKLITDAKNAADELGFTFVQAHAPAYNPLAKDYDHARGVTGMVRSIQACGMLGVRNTVTHSGITRDYLYPGDRDAYFEANRPFYRSLIPYMEEYGVNVLIENSCEVNMGGQYFPMTAEEMNAFITALGHPGFGACWDIGHAHIQKVNTHDELVTLGKNLRALHIHDNDGRHDLHLLPYCGSFDYDDLMRGIIDSGFEGYFTFEADSYRPPLKELKKEELKFLYRTGRAILEKYGMYEY